MGEYDNVTPVLIAAGRTGLYGLRNRELLPTAGLIVLRNATFEDATWRTGPGASILGAAIGSLTIQAGIDFWPDPDTQRALVSCGDGTLRKDDGAGANWVTLASGLTTAGQVPMWALGGGEDRGRSKKAFHTDRINAVRVLAGDGASMTTISRPPEDWVGSNQPGWLCAHEGFLWGGGGPNFPEATYRSLREDHEDFLTRRYIKPLWGGLRRTTAGLSYKGGLVVWGDPEGAWWIDTRDPNDLNWRVVKIGQAGCPGPLGAVAAEDDVLWVDPQGGWHLISMTDPQGTPRAQDLTQKQLGSWFRNYINRSQLHLAQMVWDGERQKAELACASQGQTQKNRRVVLDLAQKRMGLNQQPSGERWSYWDADRNEALFMRRASGVLEPTFGDASGRLWRLEQSARNRNGSGYTFEWFTRDSDFGEIYRAFMGRRKNLRYLQLVYDARTAGTHSIELYHNGEKRQTVVLDLEAGPPTLPVTLPFQLGTENMLLTRKVRLTGQAERIALRGLSTAANFDLSIAAVILGLEAA